MKPLAFYVDRTKRPAVYAICTKDGWKKVTKRKYDELMNGGRRD